MASPTSIKAPFGQDSTISQLFKSSYSTTSQEYENYFENDIEHRQFDNGIVGFTARAILGLQAGTGVADVSRVIYHD